MVERKRLKRCNEGCEDWVYAGGSFCERRDKTNNPGSVPYNGGCIFGLINQMPLEETSSHSDRR